MFPIYVVHRIPGIEIDRLRHYDTNVSRHIVVQAKGLYYTMDVYDSKNQILSPPALKSQFEWILQDAEAQLQSGTYVVLVSCRSIRWILHTLLDKFVLTFRIGPLQAL